jgi:phosphate-selective porin OprO/OprP
MRFARSGNPGGRRGRGGFSLPRPRNLAALAAAAALLAAAGPGRAADPFLVIAESADTQPLPLPSVAAEFKSFDEVSAALGDERKRIARLESRLRELEKRAAPGVEPLPAPVGAEPKPTANADAGKGAGDGRGADEAAAGEKAAKDARKPDEPYEIGSDKALKDAWKDGFQAESANKDFRVKIGGRTQVDAVAFSATPGPSQPADKGGLVPPLYDSVNFRRARLRVEGRMYELYDWACEYDFVNQLNVNNAVYPTERDAGPLTAVTDLWLQLREIPILGTVRIGNQKDPYGYEHLTSSRWLNFMERSFAQDAFEGPFNNGFLPGIQILNNNEEGNIGWQIGEFKNTTNPFAFNNQSGGSMTVGRLVWLPFFEDEGRKLMHVAVSGRTMEPKEQFMRFDPVTGQGIGEPVKAVRFRSRGDIRNGPPGPLNSIYADSGLLEGTWQNMIGLEFVGNNGPWSFQSEYFGSWLYNARTTAAGPLVTDGFQPKPGTNVGTVYYQAAYAEVLYFLTGESRTYSKIEYRFDRPVPHNNFYAIRGGGSGRRISVSEGAWQVGARYNYLCLNDSGVNGGVLNGVTLGLNWLLNPNARIYFNYDITHRNFVSTPWTKDSKGTVVPNPSYDGSGWISGFGTRLAFDF